MGGIMKIISIGIILFFIVGCNDDLTLSEPSAIECENEGCTITGTLKVQQILVSSSPITLSDNGIIILE